jgi:cyclopropane-fatty-acyl-phospholipid synthase
LTQVSAFRTTLSILDDVFRGFPGGGFRVRLWDGTVWTPDPPGEPRFVLVLRHPGSLRALLLPPTESTMTAAYLNDDVDVEGDLEAVVPFADFLMTAGRFGRRARLSLLRRLRSLPDSRGRGAAGLAARLHGRRRSVARDADATNYHYDLGNEFFALFLDPGLVYSCAYFNSPSDTIERAQEQKLEYVCRKLRLSPGERFLDVGCGWGSLVVHAAREHGVEAVGITLSPKQASFARAAIERAGLSDRCRVEVRDYRALPEGELFDKVASIGMIEHVPAPVQVDYFAGVRRVLRPGGVFLNHGIVRAHDHLRRPAASFVERFVFPDAELVTVGHHLRAAEHAGFEVRDLESLRDHYALTTRAWLSRLEQRHAQACDLVGETRYRVFRLYLAGSAAGFESGRINVHQMLLLNPAGGPTRLPLRRGDWYGEAA